MALKGIRVIEMAGLAPAPFCGMILSDLGAKVTRIDKPHMDSIDTLSRGKQSAMVDVKKEEGVHVVRRLCRNADVLLEPYRPGVMEKLGLAPDLLMADNPRLIYARLTGFGQTGPFASKAGHDINFIALSGLLSMLRWKGGPPCPPVNLLADFAGGGLMCAFGIVVALFERQTSGQGQIVDVNMTHGSAYLGASVYTAKDLFPIWGNPAGKNLLDGGQASYNVYETQDGKYMSVGCLEPKFFESLLVGLGLKQGDIVEASDADGVQQKIQEIFKTRTQSEWVEVFTPLDACVQPVLELSEAAVHPHNQHSESFLYNQFHDTWEPTPAPKLSRTPAVISAGRRPRAGQDSVSVLADAGFRQQEIDRLLRDGVVVQCDNNKSHL